MSDDRGHVVADMNKALGFIKAESTTALANLQLAHFVNDKRTINDTDENYSRDIERRFAMIQSIQRQIQETWPHLTLNPMQLAFLFQLDDNTLRGDLENLVEMLGWVEPFLENSKNQVPKLPATFD